MSHLLVIGSINLDLVLEAQQLPTPGETVLGGMFSQVNGGKGANQAVAAARGGDSDVVFIAAVGNDDFGRQVLQAYEEEARLSTKLIQTKAGVSTGVAAILVDQQAENMICVAPGANAQLTSEDVERLDDVWFDDAQVLLASMEVPLASIEQAVIRAKQRGAMVVVNPAPVVPQLAEQMFLAQVDILTPNEHEASQLSGVRVEDVESARVAAAEIRDKYSIPVVIVTLGADGVVVDSPDSSLHVQAPKVDAVDTTAAGDCFNGVLATQLAAGVPLQQAVSLAVQAASISVTRRGAQTSLPQRHEFNKL